MSCDEVQARLDDYVDGDLPEADFQRLELHLAGCAECRREERLLRSLLAQAEALPRELPTRDLWPGIAARLAPRAAARGREWWSRTVLAAAAAVAVAVAGALVVRDTPPPAPAASGGFPPEGTARLASVAESRAGLVAAEREYAQATAELMSALEGQRPALSPETVRVLEDNLRTIDEALAQVRAALETDPTDPRLVRLLTTTHQKKVDALQRVVRFNRL